MFNRLTTPICTAAPTVWAVCAWGYGPITPPAGPVAETYKTLNQVEPRTAINADNTPGDADSIYRIEEPGSYYLTANLTGESGKHGIEIDADNVTIDLMGFHLLGVEGSIDGITTGSSPDGLHITNGRVSGWSDTMGTLVYASPGVRRSRIDIGVLDLRKIAV